MPRLRNVPRELRVQRNGELFREVNERIHDLNVQWGSAERVGFVCECGATGCSAPVYLTLTEYRDARGAADCFVVAPTHVDAEHERVVATTKHYTVVERLPD